MTMPDEIKEETANIISKPDEINMRKNARERVASILRNIRLGKRGDSITTPRVEQNSVAKIKEYVEKERYGNPELKSGETVQIPTTKGEITFLKESVGWTTDRDAERYNTGLFSD